MKILILTSKFGMGHFSAAKNLEKQLKNHKIITTDLYEIAFPKNFGKIYAVYGMLMNGPVCGLVNTAYRSAVTDDGGLPKSIALPKRIIQSRLNAYLDAVKPDAVIITYSFAARLVANYLQERNLALPLITCITDIAIHNVWLNEQTTLYLAACEKTKQLLADSGVAPDHIAVCGIPVSEEFDQPKPVHAISNTKELLIIGGGLGMIPQDIKLYDQLESAADIHTTVICGKNKRAAKQLRSREYKNITVLGFCADVAGRMANADLLLTKPGGISTFEAIHAGLPMLLFDCGLEQEKYNREFVLDNKLGMAMKNCDSAEEILRLINDENALAEIKSNMKIVLNSFNRNALSEYFSHLENSSIAEGRNVC